MATLEPCSVRGFFEARVRLYFPGFATGGLKAYIQTRVTGAGVPTIWADPPIINSQDILSDAMLKLDWMDTVKVTFPVMSRDRGGYQWVVDKPTEEATGCRVRFSVSDTRSLAEQGGIRIPFRADGREFELLVPYRAAP